MTGIATQQVGAGSFSSARRVYEIALLSFLHIMKENENDGEGNIHVSDGTPVGNP
ncbi:hypothetical protein [Rhizobium herbae]|uniref:hypothetical protein n=1 Tax=Rhizobium herbae TaxID=508661 RepID=UPI001AEA9D36|nr:hypothetical protein [Rhizobium herbae]